MICETYFRSMTIFRVYVAVHLMEIITLNPVNHNIPLDVTLIPPDVSRILDVDRNVI